MLINIYCKVLDRTCFR